MVCKLHKDLYGMKQTPIAWYERLHNYLVKIGFARTNDNYNLYLNIGNNNEVLLSETIILDDWLHLTKSDIIENNVFVQNVNNVYSPMLKLLQVA